MSPMRTSEKVGGLWVKAVDKKEEEERRKKIVVKTGVERRVTRFE